AVEDKSNPFFLILHGTFGSHQMEIISTMQTLLTDEEYGSLAITLSLGEDNRSGFFDCSHTIVSTHDNAEVELGLWMKQIKSWGYTSINLVGHSRGSAQIASYAQKNKDSINKEFLIAPQVWDKKHQQDDFQSPLKLPLDDVLKKLQANLQMQLKNQQVLHCSNATVTSESFLSYYDEYPEKNTPTIIKSTTIKTKIYLGDSDPLSKRLLAQNDIFEANENIETQMIEDADHFFRDFAIEDIVSDILENVQ
ncbi:MAG: alpha/beta hydrolase, partial [Kangiellaceae bacterium]|nr:alpha/beta hydrolase [Kangiellaceae bacterium]